MFYFDCYLLLYATVGAPTNAYTLRCVHLSDVRAEDTSIILTQWRSDGAIEVYRYDRLSLRPPFPFSHPPFRSATAPSSPPPPRSAARTCHRNFLPSPWKGEPIPVLPPPPPSSSSPPRVVGGFFGYASVYASRNTRRGAPLHGGGGNKKTPCLPKDTREENPKSPPRVRVLGARVRVAQPAAVSPDAGTRFSCTLMTHRVSRVLCIRAP